MAQLKRIGPTATIDGVGRVRRNVIHTVPDNLVGDLLASGEWSEIGTRERVTEPAPSNPVAKPRRRKAVKKT